jgi:diguanylate cyclase (GGDEF)-like protein
MIEPRDELTGLRTRVGFLSLLQQRIIYAGETRSMLALVVIDIDGFAQINVASGYNTGDAVLRHLGRQLRAVARKQDAVARIGDNRFALLLTRVLNHGHVALAVQKLGRLMEAPMQFGDNRIVIQVTAGAALCPEHASHAEYLLRKAETALAAARIENRKYLMAKTALQGRDLSDQWEMEMELEGAIDRGELEMYYQPQIRMHDQRPIGGGR